MQPEYMPPVDQKKDESVTDIDRTGTHDSNQPVTQSDDSVGLQEGRKYYYYDTKSKKVKDFFGGFFGVIAILYVVSYIVSYVISNIGFYNSSNSVLIVYAIELLCVILVPIRFIIKGRKYIAIGAYSLVLIPLIAFGGCFLLFTMSMSGMN